MKRPRAKDYLHQNHPEGKKKQKKNKIFMSTKEKNVRECYLHKRGRQSNFLETSSPRIKGENEEGPFTKKETKWRQ